MANRIATQKYFVGRFTFISSLPIVGNSDDPVQWHVNIDGDRLRGTFDSLEDAMEAAARMGRILPPKFPAVTTNHRGEKL